MKVDAHIAQLIQRDLEKLNASGIMVDGKPIDPGSCYYFGADPLHVLYNTNCPDMLKKEIEKIITTYIPDVENGTFKQAEG